MMSINKVNNNLIQVYTKDQAAKDSRRRLLSTFNAVLATTMRDRNDLAGYPFGSVVPFCLNEKGEAILLISDIAQHTRNLSDNPKASLILHNTQQDNIQKGWRLTIVGDIVPIKESEFESTAARYHRHFPESEEYHQVHDFNFYKLIPKKYRYINGFGEIQWVDNDRVIQTSPFDTQTELEMIHHMNTDHYGTLCQFLETKTNLVEGEPIRMTSIDQYGFVVAMGEAIFRYFFETEAQTPEEIRSHLVAMAQKVA